MVCGGYFAAHHQTTGGLSAGAGVVLVCFLDTAHSRGVLPGSGICVFYGVLPELAGNILARAANGRRGDGRVNRPVAVQRAAVGAALFAPLVDARTPDRGLCMQRVGAPVFPAFRAVVVVRINALVGCSAGQPGLRLCVVQVAGVEFDDGCAGGGADENGFKV